MQTSWTQRTKLVAWLISHEKDITLFKNKSCNIKLNNIFERFGGIIKHLIGSIKKQKTNSLS